MTEHILNFAIGIDDDSIIKNVQERAGKEIINEIKADVLNELFTSNYYGGKAVTYDHYKDKVEVSKSAIVTGFAENIIKDVMTEYKDEIIDKAAMYLCESYKRTGAWKKRVNDELGATE